MDNMREPLNVERAVRERYTSGAHEREDALCCPVDYAPQYLEALPAEVIERDYGCGDPSRHVQPGETVLDLGAGTGKVCYIAAQVVGPRGRVIGIDVNEEMLAIARAHRQDIGDRIGYHNVEFRRGHIQDLATDLDSADVYLRQHPVASASDLVAFEEYCAEQRRTRPLVANDSIDVIVSNCVLNLVRDEDKRQLFKEMYRVLRRGGRAIISDIVADEPVPPDLKRDPELWSGCVSGAFEETAFLGAFADADFHGMEILARGEHPWRTVEGIEFRTVTVAAYKGKDGPCWERNQAVVYTGPWSAVTDDDGHTLVRGVRTAVCDKTYHLYTQKPYAQDIAPIAPRVDIPLADALPFDCARDRERSPRETKGTGYTATSDVNGSDPRCC
jgi:arsenite methyltransferase